VQVRALSPEGLFLLLEKKPLVWTAPPLFRFGVSHSRPTSSRSRRFSVYSFFEAPSDCRAPLLLSALCFPVSTLLSRSRARDSRSWQRTLIVWFLKVVTPSFRSVISEVSPLLSGLIFMIVIYCTTNPSPFTLVFYCLVSCVQVLNPSSVRSFFLFHPYD